MTADPLAEVDLAKILEALRLGFFGREMRL